MSNLHAVDQGFAQIHSIEVKKKSGSVGPFASLCLLFSFLVEFNLMGGPLRVDLGAIALGSVYRVRLLLLFVFSIGLLVLIFGFSAVIVGILVFSPFFAINSGRYWARRDFILSKKSIYHFLTPVVIVLFVIFVVQYFTYSNLFFEYFRDPKSIQPPYTIVSSELSFAFEYLFAILMLFVAIKKYRMAGFLVFFLVLIYWIGGVSSVLQNFTIAICAFIATFLLRSFQKSVLIAMAMFVVLPHLIAILSPNFFLNTGLWFYENYGSWRQMGNLFSYIDAPFLWVDNLDYRYVVGEYLRDVVIPLTGHHWFTLWFSSAFSLHPFLVSTIGVYSTILFAVVFIYHIRKIFSASFSYQFAALSLFIILMFTSPKWIMLHSFVLGYLSKRSELERAA